MEFQLDRDINALYIKLRSGKVARTIEVTTTIYIDMDADESPIGIEFTNADDFLPFMRSQVDNENIPPQVREHFRVTAA
ncbi:MAG: hypothetical protein K0S78_890 [Thermomicrobiales bacterium]|jgi:uncharacterized protein YuzE|nr:hypothetical protein [Thermomicrobiales bacterium]MDF3037639.1 hypothetical protein [Thermomicrobiales bacterium]